MSDGSLKPCSFCGSEACIDRVDEGAGYRSWYWWTVHCANRDCTCSDLCHEYATEAEAIEAWNTRHAGTCELHGCEGRISTASRPVWLCDCGAFMAEYTDATTYRKPRYCPNCGRKVVEA